MMPPACSDVRAVPFLRPETEPCSTLEQAVLLTVLYADLFDYPLTEEELYRRLLVHRTEAVALHRAVAALTPRYLSLSGPYITWKGREHLCEVRRRRREAGTQLWATARRYATWLSRVPFVRMVAVSGSLAVDNADQKSDIDLFCITEPNRLWVARLCIVPLSKLTRLFRRYFPLYLCPNYLLTLAALEVQDRNLFTANEVVQAVPLWGGSVFERFLQANPWVDDYLPQRSRTPGGHRLHEPGRRVVTQWCERVLRGKLGDALDALSYRTFRTFYRRRARRSGWVWEPLDQAYQRNRYTVPEGGYVRVVRQFFARRVQERLGWTSRHTELGWLFTLPEGDPEKGCYDWEGLFFEDYGGVQDRHADRTHAAAQPPSY